MGSDSTIALIEDDDDTRQMLARQLGRVGYRVLEYGDADSALMDMDAGRRPDLIVLDLMLPGMDGWQFRIEQKKRPALGDVPVIALSGDASPFAAAIDAAAYLTKPADFERLRTLIEHVLLATERRKLAAKAVELERMRSLGMLVAGVAHEINNPLTYVMGNLERASRRCGQVKTRAPSGPRPPTPEAAPTSAETLAEELTPVLDSAQDGAQRIAFVVQLLSTFSRGESDEVSLSDPMRALDAALRLAAHHIDGRAKLVQALKPVPFVRANEARLAQVFLNLLVNAAQAIPGGHAHQNEIRVRGWSEGAKVIIEVEDTGCGISPELLPRIFEPFYTTKPAGTGTGLGLSISRDIVQQLGGSISVRSELGHGSTFRIELPGVHADLASEVH